MHTDVFYRNRCEAIEARAELLREASTETLQELLAEVWNSQEGKVCSLVNWERFSSLQEAQVILTGEVYKNIYTYIYICFNGMDAFIHLL